jgi:hypothetical protein
MKWVLIILVYLTAAACTEYRWPVIRIVNTMDFQWSQVDTVRAVYRELTHTTVLYRDGTARQWKSPFVVQIINAEQKNED